MSDKLRDQSMGDFVLDVFSIPDKLIQPRPDSNYSFEYEFKTYRFTYEVGMDEQEKQFLVHLIEKYGAPAVVREVKARLAAMVDLDWKFDRGRWERQLNNLNREAKLRHNLSRVAKELAIANKRINWMCRNIEGQVMDYKNDLKLFRNDRYERKRRKEEILRQAERAAKYAAERERKREEAERQKAIKAEKMERSKRILFQTHKEHLQKQLDALDERLGE